MSRNIPAAAVAPVDQANPDGMVSISAKELDSIQGQLLLLDEEISRLLSQPQVHATVVSAKNEFNLKAYEKNDRVLILDKSLRKEKRFYGKISSDGVDEEGNMIVEFYDGYRTVLNIGLKDNIPQVKLLGKEDGTEVTITYNGNLMDVHGVPGTKFYATDIVKVDVQTLQIISKSEHSSAGDIAYVKAIQDEKHIEVTINGNSKIVICTLVLEDDKKIEPGDRVMIDSSNTMVTKLLKRDGADNYNVNCEIELTWDQIAGCEQAKEELIDAIETPYKNKEIYEFYKISSPKGVLLSGPPGCGKTLLAKASACALAKVHNAKVQDSGFIYVKGPELLNKYVGQSEENIRELFRRGREHYEKHGYPALLFIDEADAIMPMRGTQRSSDVENTIVPQFLSEMDGLENSHVMILLATNQPKRLDPAVIREGRVDRHVEVERPNVKNAGQYFDIYLNEIPLIKGLHKNEIIDSLVAEIFSEKHVYFRVTCQKETQMFKFSDTLNGATIKAIVDRAKTIAMKRDLTSKKPKGVTLDDFMLSCNEHVKSHSSLNTSFDMEDFCKRNGFDVKLIKVERVG